MARLLCIAAVFLVFCADEVRAGRDETHNVTVRGINYDNSTLSTIYNREMDCVWRGASPMCCFGRPWKCRGDFHDDDKNYGQAIMYSARGIIGEDPMKTTAEGWPYYLDVPGELRAFFGGECFLGGYCCARE